MKYLIEKRKVRQTGSLYYGKETVCLVINNDSDEYIGLIYDIFEDTYDHWYLCSATSHPLNSYGSDFFEEYMCYEYLDWCTQQYFKTGIVHLRNHEQVAILEPGRFRIEDV